MSKWTPEEITFIKKKISEGIHPEDFVDSLNKEFKSNRTTIAIVNKLIRLNISYDKCESEKSKKVYEELQVTEMPSQKIDLLVEKDREIQKLKSQLFIVAAKYRVANKDTNLQESILEVLRNTIKALPTVKIPIIKPSIKIEKTKETALLLLSDLHSGEVVQAAEIGDLNAYNFDIMKNRLKYLANCITDITLNKLRGYEFPKLVIGMLGDIVSGIIHDELVETAENTPIEWSEGTALVLAQFLLDLAQVFPEIEIDGVVGNHGRMHKEIRFKKRYVNWDYITYNLLNLLLKDQKNIKFNFPKSFWTIKKIEGKTFLFLHGDNINSWAGMPWYGIQRMIGRFRALLSSKNIKIDYVCLAHFHSAGTLDDVDGETIINGSVIGGTEFSVGKLFLGTHANQFFAGVHEEHGLSFRYHLNLQNIPEIKNPYVYDVNTPIVDQVNEILEE